MISQTEQFKDALLLFSIDLFKYQSYLSNEILFYFYKLETEIEDLIKYFDIAGSVQKSIQEDRINFLFLSVQDSIDRVFKEIESFILINLTKQAQLEAQWLDNLFVEITKQELLVPVKEQNITELLIVGATLSEWLSRNKESYLNNIKDNIRLSVLQNKTTDQIISDFKGVKTGRKLSFDIENKVVQETKSNIYERLHKRMQTVLSTASQTLSEETRYIAYKENSYTVRGVLADVVLDNRTSILCRGRVGFAWDLKTGKPLNSQTNINFPGNTPWHWNCRTILIPLLYGQPEPESLSYNDWLKTQPVKTQKDILGITLYNLWKSKKIDVNYNNKFGGEYLTIEQLKQKHLG